MNEQNNRHGRTTSTISGIGPFVVRPKAACQRKHTQSLIVLTPHPRSARRCPIHTGTNLPFIGPSCHLGSRNVTKDLEMRKLLKALGFREEDAGRLVQAADGMLGG